MSEEQKPYLTAFQSLENNILNGILGNFPLFKAVDRIDQRLVSSGIKGHLFLIIGGMYSGKTTKLINLINQAKDHDIKFQVFKPIIDNRYDKNKINSHNKVSTECELIENSARFSDKIMDDTEIVFIDEIQFIDSGIVQHIENLIDSGKVIVCTGLNLDFKQEAFNVIRDLLPNADYIDKLTSNCYKCNDIATLTQRLIDGKPAGYYDPVVLVGSENLYKPVCRSCYEIRK